MNLIKNKRLLEIIHLFYQATHRPVYFSTCGYYKLCFPFNTSINLLNLGKGGCWLQTTLRIWWNLWHSYSSSYSSYVSEYWGFSGGSVVKNLPANAGDADSIPRSGWLPEEGNGNPLQYLCLESHGQRSLAGYSFLITSRIHQSLNLIPRLKSNLILR